jgi:hypothetical protein
MNAAESDKLFVDCSLFSSTTGLSDIMMRPKSVKRGFEKKLPNSV